MTTALMAAPHIAAIDLNQPGTYLHWSIFEISVANLVVIAVMVAIFGAALLLPFPHRNRTLPAAAEPAPGSEPVPGAMGDDADARMWTVTGPAAGAAHTSAAETAARPAARLRCLLGLRVRGGDAGRAGPGHCLRVRHCDRRHRLVAHQPGRPFLQQHAPVERRAVHGVHGDSPVGQVLDGRLARPPGADLDHRRGGLRGLGRGVLHRLRGPAELRLPVDRHQRQGRVQRQSASARSST